MINVIWVAADTFHHDGPGAYGEVFPDPGGRKERWCKRPGTPREVEGGGFTGWPAF